MESLYILADCINRTQAGLKEETNRLVHNFKCIKSITLIAAGKLVFSEIMKFH